MWTITQNLIFCPLNLARLLKFECFDDVAIEQPNPSLMTKFISDETDKTKNIHFVLWPITRQVKRSTCDRNVDAYVMCIKHS